MGAVSKIVIGGIKAVNEHVYSSRMQKCTDKIYTSTYTRWHTTVSCYRIISKS